MTGSSDLCDTVCAQADVAPELAFDYLADPLKLGDWALGSMHTVITDLPGVVSGVSLFDGSTNYIKVAPNPALWLIDYWVGSDPAVLSMRINGRVLRATDFGYAGCLISLTAWRSKSMSNSRWQQLRAAHAVEILLIQRHCAELADN